MKTLKAMKISRVDIWTCHFASSYIWNAPWKRYHCFHICMWTETHLSCAQYSILMNLFWTLVYVSSNMMYFSLWQLWTVAVWLIQSMAGLITLMEQHLDRQPPTVVTQATTWWETVLSLVKLQESGLGIHQPVKVCYYILCICVPFMSVLRILLCAFGPFVSIH